MIHNPERLYSMPEWGGIMPDNSIMAIPDELAAREYVLAWRAAWRARNGGKDIPIHLFERNPFRSLCEKGVPYVDHGYAVSFVQSFPGVFEDQLLCGHCLAALGQMELFHG